MIKWLTEHDVESFPLSNLWIKVFSWGNKPLVPLSRSGRSLYLSDHHVPAGQEHSVPLGADEGAAAGEGERRVDDGVAARDAGGAGQAAGAAEAAAGSGAEAAGAVAGDRRAERAAGRAGAQAQGTDGQRRGLHLQHHLRPRGWERPVSQTAPQVLGPPASFQTPA